MNQTLRDEAVKIMSIFHFYRSDGNLYQSDDDEKVDAVFEAVIVAIDSCGELKPHLPYNEFVRPSRAVLEGDPGWVGHFEERDNRKFFLSDVHDFLRLFYK